VDSYFAFKKLYNNKAFQTQLVGYKWNLTKATSKENKKILWKELMKPTW
jgi:hypothetical protein